MSEPTSQPAIPQPQAEAGIESMGARRRTMLLASLGAGWRVSHASAIIRTLIAGTIVSVVIVKFIDVSVNVAAGIVGKMPSTHVVRSTYRIPDWVYWGKFTRHDKDYF